MSVAFSWPGLIFTRPMTANITAPPFASNFADTTTPAYARPVTAVATPFRRGRKHPVSLFVRRPAER